MRGLHGKVAVITGVARGQGRSHAIRLASEGVDIIGLDICRNIPGIEYDLATEADLEETAQAIERAGARTLLRVADVRDPEAVRAVVDEGVAAFGRLDAVVANAGVVAAGAVGAIPAEMWRTVAEIDLDGVWHTMTATVPHIRAGGRGGAIVLISSIAGLAPLTHLTHYAAAKHGVVGIMRSLANELGPEFIRVNTVNPTNVDTTMIHNSFGYRLMMPDVERPGRADAERPDGPYVRPHAIPVPWVDPADVSAAVAFLLSDEARYITGVAVPVDAGWLVKH